MYVMVQQEAMQAPSPIQLHTSPTVRFPQWLEEHTSLSHFFQPLQCVTTLQIYHKLQYFRASLIKVLPLQRGDLPRDAIIHITMLLLIE